VNVSTPTNPYIEDSLDVYCSGMWISENLAYITCGNNGLKIVDYENLEILGSLGTEGFAKDVVVQGNLAYIAGGEDGMVMVDVSNPSSPEEIKRFNEGGKRIM